MALFTKVVRTRTSSQSTSELQDQFIRDLTTQANQILQQFTQDLQAQASQALQNSGETLDSSSTSGAGQLLTNSVTRFENKPVTTVTASESARSQEVASQFRVSQSQALAEASQTIAKGNKNL